ncbi:MAG: ATP-dependent Zn protease [Cyanobacteriota bacterium]|nr:ATP-dependent Zn protease [Cyanobacteriota bacterium]
MKEISLNLIAVGVFAMTLSVLLGPLLNLSPAVPAIATACLLGLATIDNFQWQGQGSQILIDLFVSEEARDRIIHHEAGHFLVAYLLDIPISGYALNAWEAFRQGQSAQGGVRFNDLELASQLEKGSISSVLLDRYCTVWMAGIAAENFSYGNAEGGAEDRTKISALLLQMKRPLSESKLKQSWGFLQAQNLIETNKSAYEALVEAMKEKQSVDDCCQLIQERISVEK